MVHGLEIDYLNQIEFVYFDVDDSKTIPFQNMLGYRYHPQFLLLDGQGNIIQQWAGPVTRDDLIIAFDQALE